MGQFLYIQSSRHELVPKSYQTIGECDVSVVHHALRSVDDSLYLPMDKANPLPLKEMANLFKLKSLPLKQGINPIL